MERPFFGQTAEPNLKHKVVKYHLITNLDVNNLDILKLNNAGEIKKNAVRNSDGCTRGGVKRDTLKEV